MESVSWLINWVIRTWCFKYSSLQIFLHKFCVHLTCPGNLSLWLITLIIYGEEHRLRDSCLCTFRHSPYTSFLVAQFTLDVTVTGGDTKLGLPKKASKAPCLLAAVFVNIFYSISSGTISLFKTYKNILWR